MPNENSQPKIRTTGDLRTLLCDLLSKLENGSADLDAARTMVKVAAQVNESFYSEIKVAQVHMEAGRPAADLGNLPVGKGHQ